MTLANIGGITISDAVKRMMAYLMSETLARQYNLLGKFRKAGFQKLALFSVMCG